MLIVADARLPQTALETLSQHGTLALVKSQGIVYDSISGHPDIFICQTAHNSCVIAPNTPPYLIKTLEKHHIQYTKGDVPLSDKFPYSAAYNAVVTPQYFIHHLQHTSPLLQTHQKGKTQVHIPQAYTRCNLLALPNNSFICSDKGIEKALQKAGLETAYFSPESIVLKGHTYGFLGGCMGIHNNTVFISGALDYYKEGEALRSYLQAQNLKITELYQSPLIDGGGLLFFTHAIC